MVYIKKVILPHLTRGKQEQAEEKRFQLLEFEMVSTKEKISFLHTQQNWKLVQQNGAGRTDVLNIFSDSKDKGEALIALGDFNTKEIELPKENGHATYHTFANLALDIPKVQKALVDARTKDPKTDLPTVIHNMDISDIVRPDSCDHSIVNESAVKCLDRWLEKRYASSATKTSTSQATMFSQKDVTSTQEPEEQKLVSKKTS